MVHPMMYVVLVKDYRIVDGREAPHFFGEGQGNPQRLQEDVVVGGKLENPLICAN